jgi:chemosensory pili system protein ChpA (sensor histidine kinase/response regulator)
MAKVLIVDDEEADRLLAQAILARAGHETFFAHDGEEALRQYALKGIDVVVTDLQMPEVHGFELISVLRDFSKPPALVAVSGTGQFQLQMAEALGAKYTLTKPLDPELLVDAVSRALADRDARVAAMGPDDERDDGAASDGP